MTTRARRAFIAVLLAGLVIATLTQAALWRTDTPSDVVAGGESASIIRDSLPHHSLRPVLASETCVAVPILVYHYIRSYNNPRDPLGWQLSVGPAEFQAQMDWLREAGGNPVTLAAVVAAVNGGPALPPHPVVLTFDDGYADFATAAAPVLQREGFVGIDYVVSGFVGRPGYMTAAQVQQVEAMGMVIGAHTVNHVDLTAMPAQAAWAQIAASRSALMTLTGTPVLDFAYPYGYVNAQVAALVARAGFRDATTLILGTHQCAGRELWLQRIRVGGPDTVWSFAAKAGIAGPPPGWIDVGPPALSTRVI